MIPHRHPSPLPLLIAAICCLSATLFCTPAHGQNAAVERKRTNHFVILAPAELPDAQIDRAATLCRQALERVAPAEKVPRLPSPDPIRVLICTTREGFESRSTLPGHSTLAAASRNPRGILLNLPAILEADPIDQRLVLDHELVHLLLDDAAGPHPVPQWLHEGLAMEIAGPTHPTDGLRLAWARLLGATLPMNGLAWDFPYGEARAPLAYAQSASFVRHIARERLGYDRTVDWFHALLRDHESARELIAGLSRDEVAEALESDWRAASSRWVQVLAISTSGSVIWIGIVVLFLVAWARRRRRDREVMEHWDEWERYDDPDNP